MKTLFEDALGVVPPSTVDVDRIVARRTRIRWRQRIGGFGLAVVAAAALTTVTVVVPPDGGPEPATTASPTAPPNPADETPEQRADRYAAAFPAILAERLPGITVTGLTGVEIIERSGAGRPGTTPPRPQYVYTARVMVSGPAGTAELVVTVSNQLEGARPEIGLPECRPTRGRESCEIVDGPRGERIRRAVTDLNTSGTQPQILVDEVKAILPDRAWVSASVPRGGAMGSPGYGQGDPVLTLDQLTAIATDQRLAW